MSRYMMGVDPGASGAIVLVCCVTKRPVKIMKNPTDAMGWLRAMAEVRVYAKDADVDAVVEKVGGFVKGNPAPGSAMFNFGKGVGWMECAILAADIPILEEVVPRTWQKWFKVRPRERKEPATEFKKRLRVKAGQLFPKVEVALWNCDALLIAEYARRTYG